MGGQEDLDKSLKAIMAARREERGEPPTPEELLAYLDGRLGPAERERLESRIAVYPDAARALADLAAFPQVEPAPGTPDLSEEEIGARWQAFRERLPEPGRDEKAVSPSPTRERSGGEASEGMPPALFTRRTERGVLALRLAAAVVAGVAIGWALGTFGASREVPGSAINVKIAELTPKEEGGTRGAPAVLEMPEGAEELVLVLVTRAQEDFSDYEAEILEAQGVRIWSRKGLRPTATGTFQISFRPGALTPGSLRVRLFGRDGERRRLVETYEVRLVAGGISR